MIFVNFPDFPKFESALINGHRYLKEFWVNVQLNCALNYACMNLKSTCKPRELMGTWNILGNACGNRSIDKGKIQKIISLFLVWKPVRPNVAHSQLWSTLCFLRLSTRMVLGATTVAIGKEEILQVWVQVFVTYIERFRKSSTRNVEQLQNTGTTSDHLVYMCQIFWRTKHNTIGIFVIQRDVNKWPCIL